VRVATAASAAVRWGDASSWTDGLVGSWAGVRRAFVDAEGGVTSTVSIGEEVLAATRSTMRGCVAGVLIVDILLMWLAGCEAGVLWVCVLMLVLMVRR
jgi:hypothetical protein